MHHVAAWILVVPALLASSYLLLLAAAAWRRAPAPAPRRSTRFDVIVPAHDEEAGIARTVRSLRAVDWPQDRFRVIVVADNCSDRTAERAAEAGATVLVRRDPVLRGKGRALEYAFEHGLAEPFPDAFVVVDADSVASPGLLSTFAARLANGEDAIQSRYGVLNPDASWRTRLMTLAFALVNDVRSLGRERLGLSCGLRGNGMCFSRAALLRVRYDAFSIVEDVEYGIRLGEAGIRVAYAPEAGVLGEMVSGERASRSQRRRWEGGRRSLMLRRGPRLLGEALRRRSLLLLDLALDLLVPPLSWIVACTTVATGVAAYAVQRGAALTQLALALLSVAFICVYVLRGCVASGLGLRLVTLVPFIPVYLMWKAILLLGSARPPQHFVRTSREERKDRMDATGS